MNYKVGLVISVYDKVDDLLICIELAKKAGFHSILVVAELEKPAQLALKNLDLERIHYVKSCNFEYSKDKFNFFKSITNRVWNAQRTGLSILAKETDFVMHTHADGWVLDGEKINSLIDVLENKDLDFAYRGMGLTFSNFPGSPTGTIDDHFYIIRSTVILGSTFINKPLIDFLPGYFNIHGILSTWIISEIGISRTFHYDDTKNWLNWDNSRRNFINGNPLRPCVYNEKLKLLHCHSDDFPNGLGKALQVEYLKLTGHSEGSQVISNFIEKHFNKDCKSLLIRLYSSKKRNLMCFLDFDEDYKNLSLIDKKLNKYKTSFVKSITYNFIKVLYRIVLRKLVNRQMSTFYPLTIQEKYKNTMPIAYKDKKQLKALKKFLG
jgi:hypothetical protein